MMLSTQVGLGTAAALGAPLKNGDVIARDHSSIPPNIGTLLEAANRGRIYTQATWPQTHQRRRIGSRC